MIDWKAKMLNLDTNTLFGVSVGIAVGLCTGWFLKGRFRSRVSTPAVNPAEGAEAACADSGNVKLVLVVRTDLKMGKGKAAAQCSHAAVMAYEQISRTNKALFNEWRYNGQPKVVVKTESEESILALAQQARSAGLTVSLVRDAGRTQIAPGSKTVLGVGPGDAALVDKVTGHLKLY